MRLQCDPLESFGSNPKLWNVQHYEWDMEYLKRPTGAPARPCGSHLTFLLLVRLELWAGRSE